MKKIVVFLSIILYSSAAFADEGMWILKELNKQSAARMQELGFTFPIDSIYNENNPSLKDAVVIFGAGCTGVAVSQQGLIFTNHHCGYDAIQKHSAVEHDYLKDGFVSKSNAEELYSEGLTVSFLQKTEDVTARVTAGITANTTEKERKLVIDSLSKQITETYKDEDFLTAKIVSYYSGNKYYLLVYEVFKDVRMVFAPPSSVGKFGGETDNWMWPRHTGDFSVFRVYANKDNKASKYSADNVPYKPKYSVPVSLKGYEKNDYAMTIGYPGTTKRYLSSWGITQMVESQNKPRIEVRTAKQNIWRAAMNADDAIRIKYASKYARSSNYWKNSMGMNAAIAKLGVIKSKQQIETDFDQWLATNPAQKEKYGEALPLLKDGYTSTMKLIEVSTYYTETFRSGIEIARFAGLVAPSDKKEVAVDKKDVKEDEKEVEKKKKAAAEKEEKAIKELTDLYKDYSPALDKQLMPALLQLYAERVPAEYLPTVYKTINEQFKGDYIKYTEWLFENTHFTNLDKVLSLRLKDSVQLVQDPAIQLAMSLSECAKKLLDELEPSSQKISKGTRLFMAGLMAMNPSKAFSADANFTQRLSYGSIKGYIPRDAVDYDYFSTTQGVLEKEDPTNPEFTVQSYILDNLRSKNWGQYADKDGTMHVGFLSNNDITGGNSGSPVFNAKAELIGLAFDGNWEALSGDIVFEPRVQRTISVDIRYALYIIDKVMNCSRLIEELKLQK